MNNTEQSQKPLMEELTQLRWQVAELEASKTEHNRIEKTLQNRLKIEELITTLSTSFINLAPDDIDNGINQALQIIGESIDVDRSYVFLLSDDETKADNTHEWCAAGIEPQIANLQAMPVSLFPWWMEKLHRSENIHIPLVANLPPQANAEKELLQAQDIQSLIVVPIIYGERLIGFLGFDSVRTERIWPEETIVLLRMVADIIANALERKQRKVILQQRNQELTLLNRAGRAFNSTLDLDKVLITVLDEARHLLGAVACSIWLTDPATNELVCHQVTDPQSETVRGWRLQPEQGVASWVAGNAQSLIVPDTEKDKRHFKGVDQQTGLDIRSILAVPLQIKQKVIGVLEVVDTEVGCFQTANLTLAESLAGAATAAIENARLHQRLARHAAELEQRVTERTQELAAANERLKELDRIKSKLIEDISHELRTPITSLNLYLDLLKLGQPDKRKLYEAALRKNMNRLLRLSEGILTISRLDLFKEDVTFTPIDLNEIVKLVVAAYQQRAEASGLILTFSPGKALPLVLAENKQMRQVVTSLVQNGLIYTPAGKVQVCTYLDKERGQVCLQVKDTGMGIGPEDVPFIFDRFYRGQGIGQSNIPGTGLGLAIVKEIVDLYGGVVEVESQVEKGSTFRVCLPPVTSS